MKYERIYVDLEKLQSLVRAKGLRERDFCVMMWGKGTHRTIKEFVRHPNVKIETAMKVCNTLDITLDELFKRNKKKGESPFVIGNQNIVNSSVVNQDPKLLEVENRALKMVIKEKNERIEDLKKVNADLGKRLDHALGMVGSSNDNSQ